MKRIGWKKEKKKKKKVRYRIYRVYGKLIKILRTGFRFPQGPFVFLNNEKKTLSTVLFTSLFFYHPDIKKKETWIRKRTDLVPSGSFLDWVKWSDTQIHRHTDTHLEQTYNQPTNQPTIIRLTRPNFGRLRPIPPIPLRLVEKRLRRKVGGKKERNNNNN